jgi:hypothetical protein
MTTPTVEQIQERLAEARACSKLYRVQSTEGIGVFTFENRLQYNVRAHTWYDLKTGERGNVKGMLRGLLRKFFPQLVQVQSGGAQ